MEECEALVFNFVNRRRRRNKYKANAVAMQNKTTPTETPAIAAVFFENLFSVIKHRVVLDLNNVTHGFDRSPLFASPRDAGEPEV